MDPLTLGLAAGGGSLVSGLGSVMSGLGASRRATKERRRTRKLVAWAAQEGKRRTAQITGSLPFQTAEKFYQSYFEKGVPDFLAKDVAERMRVAGAARGIAYGAQPAVAESVGVAKLAEAGRQATAPMLLQLAQLPLQIEQQAFGLAMGQTGLGQGVAQMGPSPLELAGATFASMFQGALGGAQAAMGFGGFGGGGGGGGGGAGGVAAGIFGRGSAGVQNYFQSLTQPGGFGSYFNYGEMGEAQPVDAARPNFSLTPSAQMAGQLRAGGPYQLAGGIRPRTYTF